MSGVTDPVSGAFFPKRPKKGKASYQKFGARLRGGRIFTLEKDLSRS